MCEQGPPKGHVEARNVECAREETEVCRAVILVPRDGRR